LLNLSSKAGGQTMKRAILGVVGVTVGFAAMTASASASAGERHCSDKEIKAGILAKLGAKGQTTDLALASVSLDNKSTVAGEAKAGASTLVVSSPTSASPLQVNVASASDVDVLVCVYMRAAGGGTGVDGWRQLTNPYDAHGAFGDRDSKLELEGFKLDASKRTSSFGFVPRVDSSWDQGRVVGVVLTPSKGAAKFEIGLNKAAAVPQAAPQSAPQETGLLGVDRGAFFSQLATARMKEYNVAGKPAGAALNVSRSNGKCLSAVKRALADTNSLVKGWEGERPAEGTEDAWKFQFAMRDSATVRGYRELTSKDAKFDFKSFANLKNRLPVGTVIIYRNNDADKSRTSISPEHGHIDVVAEYDGKKSLMSDHIASRGDGWDWLGAKDDRDVDVWIFVPTEVNRTMSVPGLDLRPPPPPKRFVPRPGGPRLGPVAARGK
jgi:hypothetical protein